MTDAEKLALVRKVADVMGIAVEFNDCDNLWMINECEAYDPLTDKAQAFEIVERLKMSVDCDDNMDKWVTIKWFDKGEETEKYFLGQDADLCTAICLAAAQV